MNELNYHINFTLTPIIVELDVYQNDSTEDKDDNMSFTDLEKEARTWLSNVEEELNRLATLGISKKQKQLVTSQTVVTYPSVQHMKPVVYPHPFPDTIQPPAELYIHIPYCGSICTYCAYARSAPKGSEKQITQYLDIMALEIDLLRTQLGGKRFSVGSIYVGGGTPTLMSPEQMSRMLEMININTTLEKGGEYTVEGSPDTITPELLKTIKAHGVNRISIGVESFNNDILSTVGRRHTAEDALHTLEMIRTSGIREIDIDLIRGLPGATTETVIEDLNGVMQSQVSSVTSYQYVLKPSSMDAKKAASTYDSQLTLLMHQMFILGMKRIGYNNSMVDWYVRDKRETLRHNLRKWRNQSDLIGIGMGAYGFIGAVQYQNSSKLSEYSKSLLQGQLPIQLAVTLNTDELARRNLIFGIKTGILRDYFSEKHGFDPLEGPWSEVLALLEKNKAVTVTANSLGLSEIGRLFADWIQMMLFSEQYAVEGFCF
jgi:oxygen-independent coproporphyrinogen-3 oxidase